VSRSRETIRPSDPISPPRQTKRPVDDQVNQVAQSILDEVLYHAVYLARELGVPPTEEPQRRADQCLPG
jgi:hypothetical protein